MDPYRMLSLTTGGSNSELSVSFVLKSSMVVCPGCSSMHIALLTSLYDHPMNAMSWPKLCTSSALTP
jgi:hypothetical protein